MSNLVPKSIVDKNGVSTTRNINPDKGVASKNDRAAKVGAPPKADRGESLRKPLERIQMASNSYTVGHWVHAKNLYDFDAPYQRGSVWDEDRKRSLISSLLQGIPTGAVILNKRPFNSGPHLGAVVDGKQRIEAVLDFLEDRLEVPGSWFDAESLPDFKENVRFSDLAPGFQSSFQYTTILPSMEASVETIEEEAEIFLRINQGGVAQEDSVMDRAKGIASTTSR
jgi:hypothetical protein